MLYVIYYSHLYANQQKIKRHLVTNSGIVRTVGAERDTNSHEQKACSHQSHSAVFNISAEIGVDGNAVIMD